MHLPSTVTLLAAGRLALGNQSSLDRDWTISEDEVLVRDVCIIGGGSSGTYAAIRLQQLNKSVIVVEKNDHLGGHTETFTDPTTGKAVDYGVVNFEETTISTAYFQHLGIRWEGWEGGNPAKWQKIGLDAGKLIGEPTESLQNSDERLGGDTLLSAQVVQVSRDRESTQLVVDTPSGRQQIRAKKLIVTIPPLVNDLRFMDLHPREIDLFHQFAHGYLYTGLVRVDGFPSDVATVVPGLIVVHFGSDIPLTDEEVQEQAVEQLLRFRQAGVDISQPEIVIMKSHAPYELRVSPQAIVDGFYDNLNSLQGYQGTFWTGVAFETHDSQQIWKFTEQLIQDQVLKSLEE
ncbi:hypothetical protein BJX99DRAFT_255551 [Aspergillus californicus]